MCGVLWGYGWVPEGALRLHKLPVPPHEPQEVLLQHMRNDWGALKLCGAAQPIVHDLHVPITKSA